MKAQNMITENIAKDRLDEASKNLSNAIDQNDKSLVTFYVGKLHGLMLAYDDCMPYFSLSEYADIADKAYKYVYEI